MRSQRSEPASSPISGWGSWPPPRQLDATSSFWTNCLTLYDWWGDVVSDLLRDAWLSLGKHPVVGPLARDLARAVDSGAAVQTVLSRRGNEIQSERRAAVEARAKAVGVRTVIPLGLCFLPAFLLLGIVPVVAGLLGLVLLP